MKRIKLLLFLLIPTFGFAQQAIYQKVMEMESQAISTAPNFSLMTDLSDDISSRSATLDEVTSGIVFKPAFDGMKRIMQASKDRISMDFTLPDNQGDVKLELVKHKLLTDDFILSTSGKGNIKYKTGAYYHGIISGDANSLVAISIFEDQVIGFINNDKGNFVIGKLNDADVDHIIYNDKNLTSAPNWECTTPDDDVQYSSEMLTWDGSSRDVGDCIRVYIEIDDDIVTQKGGATPATNYITGLFNEVITLYANEQLAMSISEIKAWTTNSPYSSNSSSGMLSDFQNNTGSFNGDLGHLVSYQASGGIAAGFSGICNSNPDNSKCFSSIDATYNSVPAYSYSVMVTTHEMGHLIGSRHTHACVWNGNNTAIDGCSGQTEGSCPLPGNPSNGGTIMSYCHITSAGINFNLGFGPQPGNVIRNTVANANCLSPCGGGGPTCTDGVQNGQETGVDCGGPDCPACPQGCSDNEVTLSFVFDNYPEETSWTITNSSGAVVASGGTYGSQPDGSSLSITECLVDGCYDLTISDSYGDGICCAYGSGSYTLTDASGGVLASGGAFGSTDVTNFCVGSGTAPTCTDGVQNGQETGVDCGGPDCPACPTCNDGIQNGQETGVDCGGPDCSACPTCNDGVQNGQETGVDCGGPDCAACPPGGTTELFGSYFESGLDGWQDGGSDCFRYNGSRSYEGNYSIRLRDNSGSRSAMTRNNVDLTGYSSVEVTFYFYAYSMENGEDFWLRVNDGTGWQTVAAWARGTSFNNNTFYTTSVTISAADFNFNSGFDFRFQCDASSNADQVYIDQVTAVATSGGSLIEGTGINYVNELGTINEDPTELPESVVVGNEIKMYPNPATDRVSIVSNNEIESIQVISTNGQLVRSFDTKTYNEEVILSDLQPGVYYLMIQVNGEIIPKKLIKM